MEYLQVTTLILTGIAGNICVHFTANDAYLRDFQLFIPPDCVASQTLEENSVALTQMQRLLGADISESSVLDLHQLNTRTSQN